jgi:hypothetical protein
LGLQTGSDGFDTAGKGDGSHAVEDVTSPGCQLSNAVSRSSFQYLTENLDSGGRPIYATVAGAIQAGSKQRLGLETSIKRIEKRINQECGSDEG